MDASSDTPETPMPDALAPILAALAGDHTVAAWDVENPDAPTLSVFEVASAPPRQLAYLPVPVAERKALKSALADKGFVNGSYCRGTDFVWRHTDEVFELWSSEGLALAADANEVRLADGAVLPRQQVSALVPSLGAGGVARKLHLRAGTASHLIVAEYDPAVGAGIDPAPREWDDVRWMSALGYKLARWLSVPIEA